VKERILQTLRDLRAYALAKGHEVSLLYHEEDSSLMRFANSAISLNTHEHLIRLVIEAYDGKKRARSELITNLDQIEEMKQGIDAAAEMVEHAQPLSYQPTIAEFSEPFEDQSGYDAALAQMSNAEKLAYFNAAVADLETEDLRLSGIFSCGQTLLAQITTRSEHTQFFRTSDAQVTAVLAHARLKWEISAEQSAQKKADLDAAAVREELAWLAQHYQSGEPQQLPLGRYTIVLGAAATAQLLRYMSFIGFNGGWMKRAYSFLSEEKIGQRVFSERFTLVDDPSQPATFPFKRDFLGIPRRHFTIFRQGVFQGFTWAQDDADEFGATATGHTVNHTSLVLQAGDQAVRSLQELGEMRRDEDVVYIPTLHYMNIVNPSAGLATASSRFGALLLKKDGSIGIPYNVRLTQSLLDIFGDRLEWLSQASGPHNISISYGARNPTAIIVPRFIQVKDLEISHSNASF
jgi:predicted Zn-dependent protease